ncbi:MAG: ABC transporter permease [Treponema sp.]|nr:ABC transporter permease [Treponema sp.]
MKKISFNLVVGLFLICIVFSLAFVSVFFTPYKISEMNVYSRNLPPSINHLAGTDSLGRDIFSRLMVGARFTLLVALVTVTVSTFIGSVIGLISGYVGGIVDEIIMRLADVFSSFPGILTALVIVTVLNYGQYTIVIALCIMFIPSYVRIVRVGTLQYKKSEFIQNYLVYGASHFRLLFVHIYPNVFPLVFPSIIIGISNAILAESSMSYLGLGIQPPVPSWGWMLNEAQNSIFTAPWYAICTGLIIVITITGFNCLGEGFRNSYGK